ncbi:molybdopterin converting factor subunit 1 [Chloroflexota bacterium]
MKVTVKFFARYREIVGDAEVALEVDDGATVAGLISKLVEQYPDFPTDPHMAAVNAEYVEPDTILHEGDEAAFFPPFSGG